MLSKIANLPTSVKVVAWLNLIGGGLSLISGLAMLQAGPASEIVKSIGSALISFLVVAGLFQRSKTVRMLVLVFAWIGVIICSFALVLVVFFAGIAGVVILIPLAVSAVTVWGLRTEEAKKYFRLGVSDGPPVTRDWMGNPVAQK